ncbi:MAG: serine/threonine protein kinase [Planctomycetes bacterium]|jgi:serine/threonine protein kinase|nr:serine/threonine protein kinase [Planctomycetota bacterium]
MFCARCGNTLSDDAQFCTACGRPVTGTPPPAAPSPLPVAAPPAATLSGDTTRVLPAAPVLTPGEVFDRRYRIERVLGQGGMGAVYLANDQVTGDPVCLKVIRPDLLEVPALAQRFLREGKITRALRHPAVVAVYDVNVSDGRHYITMEYLPGTTLREWLRSAAAGGARIDLPRAARVLSEILAGLEAVHGAELVHRDLKPENVMLLGDPGAPDFRLKLLDFGIARPLRSGDNLTVAGAAIGTPAYMAPEQELGIEVGPAADLYSAGAIFYEMLAGAAPRGRWALPSAIRPDLPPAVDRFCEKALEAAPARRHGSVAGMRRDLEGLTGKAPPPLPPPVPGGPRPTPPPPRSPPPPMPAVPSLFAGGRRPARTLNGPGGYALYSYVPGLAWLTWVFAYKASRRPHYILFAILYSIPLLVLFGAIGDEFMDEDLVVATILLLILGVTASIAHLRLAPPKVPG